jgi:tight adherence protein C
MLWIILLTTFLAVSLLAYSALVFWSHRQRVKARLGNPHSGAAVTFLRKEDEVGPLQRWFENWLSSYGAWALKDLDKVSKVREQLIRSGLRNPQAVALFYGFRVLFALLLPLPLLLAFFVKGTLTPFNLLLAFAFSGVGFFLPSFLLSVRVRARQNRLDKALPDILDLFVICMEAGLALNAALNRVADEIRAVYWDFYTELQITGAELRTGIPWDEAFDNLGKRTGVQSVKSLVGLMIQSERLGASIGDALRNHGDFVRTQRMLRAEEKAAKLPLKLIFPLILCIFPAMFIVTVGPGVIHIVDLLFPLFKGVR